MTEYVNTPCSVHIVLSVCMCSHSWLLGSGKPVRVLFPGKDHCSPSNMEGEVPGFSVEECCLCPRSHALIIMSLFYLQELCVIMRMADNSHRPVV